MAAQKVTIFIDTNIYLRFYDSKQSNFKKLLSSLDEIYRYIFITKQIVDEIDRNKQDLFKRSFDGYITQSKLSSVELPEHLSTNTDDKIKKWNIKRAKIENFSKTEQAALKNISRDILNEILKGEDEISKVLNSISGHVEEPSEEILKKAKIRKDFGNPPGKKEDTIGDQLNWELLLEFIDTETIEDLIIISTDYDFFVINNTEIQLNAKLFKELNDINDSINIYCFNSLTDGLKKFNEIVKIRDLPNSEELEQIKAEEEESLLRAFKSNLFSAKYPIFDQFRNSNFFGPTNSLLADINTSPLAEQFLLNRHSIVVCPHCGQKTLTPMNTFQKDGRIFRSYQCKQCEYQDDVPLAS